MLPILPYLVVPLFFTADVIATEETVKAGVEGYKQRAEAVRKKAIAAIEGRIAKETQSLAAAKKGKLLATMVGTGTDERRTPDGSWEFATMDDRASRVWWLTKELGEYRELLAGLKAKKLYPQIRVPFKSPGGCGCFPGGILPTKITGDEVRAWAITERLDIPTDCIFETLEREGFEEGKAAPIRGVYQFTALRGDRPVFRHVKELPVGACKCLFDERGDFHVWP